MLNPNRVSGLMMLTRCQDISVSFSVFMRPIEAFKLPHWECVEVTLTVVSFIAAVVIEQKPPKQAVRFVVSIQASKCYICEPC